MIFVSQCGRCGSRTTEQEKTPHKAGCRGRKVEIVVYSDDDFKQRTLNDFRHRPINIRVTDNGGASADRYSIYRTTPVGFVLDYPSYGPGWVGYFIYGSANAHPFHPQGIGMTGETDRRLWEKHSRPKDERPVKWAALPRDVRKFAWQLATDFAAEKVS